jgi:hypothetical protein
VCKTATQGNCLLQVVGFGNEAVCDVALSFFFNEISNLMPFLRYLPCDVTDQPSQRIEEKFPFLHKESLDRGFQANLSFPGKRQSSYFAGSSEASFVGLKSSLTP